MRLVRCALLFLIACLGAAAAVAASSATSPPPAPVQPALAPLVTPRASELSSVGIQRIAARMGKQRRDIQVLTGHGSVYFAWPKNVTPVAFVIEVGTGGALTVRADGYTEANNPRYAAAFDAVLPEAVRRTRTNNAWATRPKT